MIGYANVSGQGGEATGALAASRRRGQDMASEGGARARHEEVRTWCRATAECQGSRGAGDSAVSHDWGRGVIAELITIVTGIDFCLPDLL